jgi:hypothetical protein
MLISLHSKRSSLGMAGKWQAGRRISDLLNAFKGQSCFLCEAIIKANIF